MAELSRDGVRERWEALATMGRVRLHYYATEPFSNSPIPNLKPKKSKKEEKEKEKEKERGQKRGQKRRAESAKEEGAIIAVPQSLTRQELRAEWEALLRWAMESGLELAESLGRRRLLISLAQTLPGLLHSNPARRDADLRALEFLAVGLSLLPSDPNPRDFFQRELRAAVMEAVTACLSSGRHFLHFCRAVQAELGEGRQFGRNAEVIVLAWYQRQPATTVAAQIADEHCYDHIAAERRHGSVIVQHRDVFKFLKKAAWEQLRRDPSTALMLDFVWKGSVDGTAAMGESAETLAVRKVFLLRDRVRARDWDQGDVATIVADAEWMRRGMIPARYWERGGTVEETLLARDEPLAVAKAASAMTVRGTLRPEEYKAREERRKDVGAGTSHGYKAKLSKAEMEAPRVWEAFSTRLNTAPLDRTPAEALSLAQHRYMAEKGAFARNERRMREMGGEKRPPATVTPSEAVGVVLSEAAKRALAEAKPKFHLGGEGKQPPFLFLSLPQPEAKSRLHTAPPFTPLHAAIAVQLRLGAELRAFPVLRSALSKGRLAVEDDREIREALEDVDLSDAEAEDSDFFAEAMGNRPFITKQLRWERDVEAAPHSSGNSAQGRSKKKSRAKKAAVKGVCYPCYPQQPGLSLQSGIFEKVTNAIRAGERDWPRLEDALFPCLPNTFRPPSDLSPVFQVPGYAGEDVVLLLLHFHARTLRPFHEALTAKRAEFGRPIKAVLVLLFGTDHHRLEPGRLPPPDPNLLLISNYDSHTPDIIAQFLANTQL